VPLAVFAGGVLEASGEKKVGGGGLGVIFVV